MFRSIASAGIMALASAAGAQVVPTGPFNGSLFEDFSTTAEGSHVSFPVFGGNGTVSRMGGSNALVVTNSSTLPPKSVPNAMFGRGADAEWKVAAPMRRFGGYFRDVNAGIPVNQVTFVFYDQFNAIIGAPVNAPLNNVWTWIGWETSVPWVRVEVIGNGSLDGYVGHDDMTADREPGQRECYADCDGNGRLDIRDFFCFQRRYAEGCR